MSEFMVTIEEIAEINNIENADRLQLAKLKGLDFQFVIPKDQYELGEYVVYFPVDSILPIDLIDRLGLTGKLAGKDKNRVKTIKLRGVISQGIVAKFDTVFEFAEISNTDLIFPEDWVTGTDITELVFVKKYEIDDTYIPNGKGTGRAGWLKPLPSHVAKYDIESCQRNMDIVKIHLINDDIDEFVVITEKLEGSHFALTVNRDGNWTVCQRNYAIDPEKIENHLWVKLAMDSGLIEKGLHTLLYQVEYANAQNITFRGEVIGPGVQGNIYKLDKPALKIFEVEFDGLPIAAVQFLSFCDYWKIDTVPVLYAGLIHKWINRVTGADNIVDSSNGKSEINPSVLREGIVIKPAHEEKYIQRFGRLILKVRSPQYLAGSEL